LKPINKERVESEPVYPATFFGLFPPFPRDNRAFVAMSFDARFKSRWENVIHPAIGRVHANGIPLDPYRVDLGKASDSILTEILDSISRCRVFIADITEIGELDGNAIRNANVLYEVGLAHAVRSPEEVILIRSDKKRIMFDITQVRVHDYDPDGSPDAARDKLASTIVDSLKEVDLKKQLAVRRGAQSLDFHSWMVLMEANSKGPIYHPETRTMGQVLGGSSRTRAISKLLDLAALEAEFVKLTPELIRGGDQSSAEKLVAYRITAFGSALVDHAVSQMGMLTGDVRQELERATNSGA